MMSRNTFHIWNFFSLKKYFDSCEVVGALSPVLAHAHLSAEPKMLLNTANNELFFSFPAPCAKIDLAK